VLLQTVASQVFPGLTASVSYGIIKGPMANICNWELQLTCRIVL